MTTNIPECTEPTSHGLPLAALDDESLHRALYSFAAERLRPGVPNPDRIQKGLARAYRMSLIEHQFLETERARVSARAALVPREAQAFATWFEALRENGPGQYDPLFDSLADVASPAQVRWFVQQEVAGEAGFEDLLALAQLRMPTRAKLEMARNFWDEMGRGKANGMHGPLLRVLADELDVSDTPADDIVWESLALANLLVGLAHNRAYAFHAVGALGAVELTAPTRAARVAAALSRVGVSKQATYYFRLHATIDVCHFSTWKSEVLLPLVAERPEVAPLIAEGALMRLEAGRRTFERYRRELGLSAVPSRTANTSRA